MSYKFCSLGIYDSPQGTAKLFFYFIYYNVAHGNLYNQKCTQKGSIVSVQKTKFWISNQGITRHNPLITNFFLGEVAAQYQVCRCLTLYLINLILPTNRSRLLWVCFLNDPKASKDAQEIKHIILGYEDCLASALLVYFRDISLSALNLSHLRLEKSNSEFGMEGFEFLHFVKPPSTFFSILSLSLPQAILGT